MRGSRYFRSKACVRRCNMVTCSAGLCMHDWRCVCTGEQGAAGRPSVGHQKVTTVTTRVAEFTHYSWHTTYRDITLTRQAADCHIFQRTPRNCWNNQALKWCNGPISKQTPGWVRVIYRSEGIKTGLSWNPGPFSVHFLENVYNKLSKPLDQSI